MKRSVKIILVIVAVVLVGGTYFGYQIYQLVMGSEPISGKQGTIPTAVHSIPPITTGIADWTNWRGDNFEYFTFRKSRTPVSMFCHFAK